jgi:hypothetical protein
MKLAVTLGMVGIVLAALSGCGSSTPPPPFSLSCVTRVLPSGALRVAITVKRTTSGTQKAILYGPALRSMTHEYPLVRTRFVNDRTGKLQTTYIGLIVPRFTKKGTSYLLLRFSPPARSHRLYVTDTATVKESPQQGTACMIKH